MIKTILILILISSNLFSQELYRVFFTDKGPQSENTFEPVLENLSDQAWNRRAKMTNNTVIHFLEEDRFIYRSYVDSVNSITGNILLELNWNNYVVTRIDSQDVELIESFTFVDRLVPIKSRRAFGNSSHEIDFLQEYVMESFRYGGSEAPLEALNVLELHSKGFNGQGVTIGFIDSGYDWIDDPIFEGINVVAERDFIFGDDVTANQEGDRGNQDHHGTAVLSLVSGYLQDTLIGIANQANVVIAKTEDLRSETHIEEDYFAAAVEWMDALGVEIINSSLGYRYFNQGQENYEYEDMDGRSTIVSDIVNKAAARGILFFTSAGNDGKKGERSLISPAEADSVISVGAIRLDVDSVANFSSRGPRVDDVIYPKIVAPGVSILAAAPSSSTNTVIRANGTSFASPLAAGATSLYLGAFKNIPTWEIRQKLYQSCHRYEDQDSDYGYGMPDIQKMFDESGIAISYPSYYPIEDSKMRVVFYTHSKVEINDLRIIAANGVVHTVNPGIEDDQYYADIHFDYFIDNQFDYMIASSDGESEFNLPIQNTYQILINGKNNYLSVQLDSTFIQRGVDPTIFPTSVNEKKTFNYVAYQASVLNFSVGNKYSDAEVYIYDLLGNLVFKEKRRIMDHNQIDINLRSGLYLLVVNTGIEIYSDKFSTTR